ncbi:MAG: hypothetical protein ABSC19_06635 [Syntrophorhabdales bacterium]|jgi:hypothetical protein
MMAKTKRDRTILPDRDGVVQTTRKRRFRGLRALLALTALSLGILTASGCQAPPPVRPSGPAWAPTQASRTRHQYRYYPESAVYMDTGRKLFFYHNGERWTATPLLPPTIQVDWKNYVVLEMGTDKPYRYHADVIKRYPPDRRKKGEKAKAERE